MLQKWLHVVVDEFTVSVINIMWTRTIVVEICRTPFAATNPVRVPDREQQRQQAIRDLEALFEPGAIEDWITQVGGLGVSSDLQESLVQVSPRMYKYHLTLRM